jgi:hypothetical protein
MAENNIHWQIVAMLVELNARPRPGRIGLTQALRDELVLSDWDLCLWLSDQIALTAVVDEAYRLS